jgi:hypothetical protein
MNDVALTTTDLIAAATQILVDGGYALIPLDEAVLGAAGSRCFEDTYGVVAVVVYSTWSDLANSWFEAQAQLIDLMSRNLSEGDPKAWEGYLVLMTPGVPDLPNSDDVDAIRYDTTRLRKFVATGDDMSTLTDIDRVLSPLLPLSAEPQTAAEETVLEHLPDLLAKSGVDRNFVRAIVSAYRTQRPLLEALDEARRA